MKKLHLGCGAVYLTPSILTDVENGWVNLDARGGHMALASEQPELTQALSTTDEKYYARHEDKTIEKLRTGAAKILGVCDMFGIADRIPLPDRSVEEILVRQAFEHLSITEARRALLEFDRVLVPGGILRLDVPDTEATAQALKETKDDFYVRHLFGSRKDEYAYHLMGYDRVGLAALLGEYGFELQKEEPNVHFYPAFCLRFRKAPFPIPAWQYVESQCRIAIASDWKVLEIGPGSFPWPKAHCYVDHEDKFAVAGKPFVKADLSRDRLPFADKEWDFVFASHIFEHLENPIAAAAELTRVAKRGLLVTPHPYKEVLTGFEEGDHRWLVWPPRKNSERQEARESVIFWPLHDERVSALRDSNVQAALARVFRIGPARFDHDSVLLRRWFQRNEAWLDTIHYWKGELKVRVE